MAFHAIYRCTNPSCTFSVRLWEELPEWKADTPPGLAKLPVCKANEQYVARYTNEGYCTACNQMVEVGSESVCSNCNAKGQFLEAGSSCPECEEGETRLVKGVVI